MRVLLVGAGASFSTKDVELGVHSALVELGHQSIIYLLDRRIDIMTQWCKFVWRNLYDKDPARKPGWEDACYRAGIEALEQALRYEVDWVFIISGMYLHPDIMAMMRRAHLKIACYFTESPYEDEKQVRYHAKLANICFVNERTSVDFFRQYNPNSFYLPHSFNLERMIGSASITADTHDVVFVGSGFKERIDLLSAVNWDGIDLGLYGTWTLLPRRHKLRKYIRRGVVSNEEALALYKSAKIGLNLYRLSKEYAPDSEFITKAESANPRAYELAATSTFCLTEYRKEALEIFGISQPTFDNAEDLEKKIRWFLSHGSDRKRLATLAYRKVQGLTFVARMSHVMEILNGC